MVVKPSTDLTLEVTVEDVKEDGSAVIKVTATDGEGKPVAVDKVNVTVGDGEPIELPVDSTTGTVSIPADTLSTGDNSVKVAVDDGVHDPVVVTETITVPAATIVETEITVTATNISYGDKAVIEFTLKDKDGNPLSGKLNVTVGDINRTVDVKANGVGTLELEGLTADTYPIVANYVGQDKYADSVGTGSFNVAKNATMIIYEDMTTTAVDYVNDGRVGKYFYWKLVDANGNPIANARVQIGFNGVIYNRTTNSSGMASLQINLNRTDLYTFAISFLGDKNHNGSFVVAKIKVVAQTPTLSVPKKSYAASAKTKTLTATFKSDKGTLIANKKVTFTVNGKTYTAKTNDKGVASVNVSISKKGTYTVTAKFAGDQIYKAINKTSTLKIT